MATTVKQAFSIFTKDEVNLDPDRTKVGRSSRNWLIKQLNNLPAKEAGFPRVYTEKNIQYGSFARNTKINPLDDIDLILALSSEQGCYYSKNYSNDYSINVPQDASNLYALCDNGVLNSRKVVNKLKSSLGKIEHYKLADIHRQQEAATLQLQSYEWNFDIVPAFYTDRGFYLIPDGSGQWKSTNPSVDQERINKANYRHNGNALQFVRTLKFWVRQAQMPKMTSYLFENIIINFLDSHSPINSTYHPLDLWAFWRTLEAEIYSAVMDPKGMQGNLNTLSYTEQNEVSQYARKIHLLAAGAITADSDPKQAIGIWRKIFGDDFPQYG
jgi:hypothetical protein